MTVIAWRFGASAFHRRTLIYLVVVGSSLEPTDEELESLREVLAYVVPIALVLAGAGGWFLARQSLAPVVAMAERARKIGVDDLSARLPVANPRDELGQLADNVQRPAEPARSLADRSSGSSWPTPPTNCGRLSPRREPQPRSPCSNRTANEEEYRETLGIIEQQTTRLTRIVEDMFTLARADAGSYPVRRTPDVPRRSRGRCRSCGSCPRRHEAGVDRVGDDRIGVVHRRRGARTSSHRQPARQRRQACATAHVSRQARSDIESRTTMCFRSPTQGDGIPPEIQPHIFERFFRGDVARTSSAGGAGLGSGAGSLGR